MSPSGELLRLSRRRPIPRAFAERLADQPTPAAGAQQKGGRGHAHLGSAIANIETDLVLLSSDGHRHRRLCVPDRVGDQLAGHQPDGHQLDGLNPVGEAVVL